MRAQCLHILHNLASEYQAETLHRGIGELGRDSFFELGYLDMGQLNFQSTIYLKIPFLSKHFPQFPQVVSLSASSLGWWFSWAEQINTIDKLLLYCFHRPHLKLRPPCCLPCLTRSLQWCSLPEGKLLLLLGGRASSAIKRQRHCWESRSLESSSRNLLCWSEYAATACYTTEYNTARPVDDE